jgi:septum formation protein
MRLILASTSPRRREILALLGLPFDVIPPEFEERVSLDRSAETEVLQFAVGKAESVAKDNPDAIVIGADTMIVLDEIRFGKPRGIDNAKNILATLSGRTHRILTSVAVVDEGATPGWQHLEQVLVKMRPYSAEEIEQYLQQNESLDKAGAYSIQGHGRALIESIRGDYLAAVGMPLRPIARYLEGRRLAVPVDVEALYRDRRFLNWRSFDQ